MRKLIVFSLCAVALLVAPAASAKIIVGTKGDDTLVGTEKQDHIFGRAGNDTISGLAGGDFLFGQRGNDRVTGGDGNDWVWGRPGDDVVDGGAGDDRIRVGYGVDTAQGGPGNDAVWALAKDEQVDTIDCGAGDRDRAYVRPGDVATNCEKVVILTPTS